MLRLIYIRLFEFVSITICFPFTHSLSLYPSSFSFNFLVASLLSISLSISLTHIQKQTDYKIASGNEFRLQSILHIPFREFSYSCRTIRFFFSIKINIHFQRYHLHKFIYVYIVYTYDKNCIHLRCAFADFVNISIN